MVKLSKKEDSIRSKLVVFFLILLFLVVLNFFQEEVRSFFYYFSSPIQKVLWKEGDSLSDFFVSLIRRGEIEKDKENLNLENQKLVSEVARLLEYKEENEELRKALNIELNKDFDLESARIIGKDSGEDIFLIDKGERDSILVDMPVITAEKALVGRIVQIYPNFSKVELISNKETDFGAEIQGKEITAIARGQGNFGLLLDLIEKDKELGIGDTVITAGLGKIFPPNLLVGRIKEIKREDVESIQRALVEISFDFSAVSHLLIIKDF